MPTMPAIGDLDFENLVEALINEQQARFTVRTKAGLEHTGGWHAGETAYHRGRLERTGPSPRGDRSDHDRRCRHPQGGGRQRARRLTLPGNV